MRGYASNGEVVPGDGSLGARKIPVELGTFMRLIL